MDASVDITWHVLTDYASIKVSFDTHFFMHPINNKAEISITATIAIDNIFITVQDVNFHTNIQFSNSHKKLICCLWTSCSLHDAVLTLQLVIFLSLSGIIKH